MIYYERGDFSDRAGPGVSQRWAEATAKKALTVLPAAKTSLAFSAAAVDWELPVPALRVRRKVARLHYRRALELLARTGARAEWDDVQGAPVFRYQKDGKRHEVWYEDERSLGRKFDAAAKLGAGAALWYLGDRRPDLAKAGLCPHDGRAGK